MIKKCVQINIKVFLKLIIVFNNFCDALKWPFCVTQQCYKIPVVYSSFSQTIYSPYFPVST